MGQPGGRGGSAGGEGGSAKIEQHREYLLHGGRYASCVHAGGLSCVKFVFTGAFFTPPQKVVTPA